MKPLVWSLDDEQSNLDTVRSTLGQDFWMDDRHHGVELQTFRRKSDLLDQLRTINDVNALPCLFLLDVDLGGTPSDSYGGFEVWHTVMDKFQTLQLRVDRDSNLDRPEVVLYTRHSEVLKLAQFLNHDLANPKVIPFNARSNKVAAADVQSAVSDPLGQVLARIAGRCLGQLLPDQRGKLLNSINAANRAEDLANIEIGPYKASQLFPRVVLPALQAEGQLKVAKEALTSYVTTNGRGFRYVISDILRNYRNPPDLSAFSDKSSILAIARELELNGDTEAKVKEAGSFFRALDAVFTKTEWKPDHLLQEIIQGRNGAMSSYAMAIAHESILRWEKAFENEAHTSLSELWMAIVNLAQSANLDTAGRLHKAFIEYKFEAADGSRFKAAVADIPTKQLDIRLRGQTLGVLMEDLTQLEKCVFHECNEEVEVKTVYGAKWLAGQSRMGVHFFCNRGTCREFSSNVVKAAMESTLITADTLAQLADLVCRRYGGQLTVGVTDSTGSSIDEMVVRWPSASYCSPVTQSQKAAVYENWRSCLQGQANCSFNVLSFPTLI
jgi:hypothetical protein